MWVKHHRSHDISLCALISFSISVLVLGAPQQIRCPVQSLYQFGDSISDTGNTIRILPNSASGRRPFGETLARYPTGRWSDGRLIIDYIAMALGLPLLNPYLAKNVSFNNGVNFAVAGSTALDLSFFSIKGVAIPPLPPLCLQLTWFRTHLNSTSTDKLSKSLVFVGETGYNDIRYPILQGRSVQETYTYIPFVVQAIINTTREVIKAGGSQVVVPGNFPLGCFPWVLSALPSNDPKSYDDLGCLKSVNNLTTFMNNQLQEALDSLRNEFPKVVILYSDYYNAFQSLLRNASTLGFDTEILLKPCCGIRGKYDPLSITFCGNAGVPVCPNPNIYIHWDGVHLTQEAYRRMTAILISDLKINCI